MKSLLWPGAPGRCFRGAALFSLGSLLLNSPAHAQESTQRYDLQECVRIALTSSDELRASDESRRAADAAADAARARRWPTMSLGADASYVSEVNEFELPAMPPRTIRFGDNDSYGVMAGLELPVYSGGALSATEDAQRSVAAASAFDAAADSLRVVRAVRVEFYRALGAQAEVEAATLSVQRLERHVREIEGQIRLGSASEEAGLQVQSRLRSFTQRLLAAEEQRSIARLRLGTLLGLPNQGIVPEGELDSSLLSEPAETSGGDSIGGRPELHALDLRRRAFEARRRAAQGAFLPSIVANAQLHYAKPGVRVIDDEWMDWVSATVQLRWTLWDWGQRSAHVSEMVASARVIAHQQGSLKRALQHALAVSRAQVESQNAQISQLQQRVELERQRLGMVESRYAQGLGTESELLDVQDDLAEAELSLAGTRALLRIAEVDLLYAMAR